VSASRTKAHLDTTERLLRLRVARSARNRACLGQFQLNVAAQSCTRYSPITKACLDLQPLLRRMSDHKHSVLATGRKQPVVDEDRSVGHRCRTVRGNDASV